jgi:hypothetical protein
MVLTLSWFVGQACGLIWTCGYLELKYLLMLDECGEFEHAGAPSAIHQEIYHVFTLWYHAIILSLHNMNLYHHLGLNG